MDETELKYVVEAALLAAGRPVSIDQLAALFGKRANVDRSLVKRTLEQLSEEYSERGIELKEVASGYRIQIRRTMTDWLTPLWEERAPRYTRALLETLALIAYRQPITRGEIEEIRGVVVSPNIIRSLMERNWVRVVGHRDVPGKPEMFGTTKDFLDYFGLKRLEDLPPLSEIKDLTDLNSGLQFLESHPQNDIIEVMVGELATSSAGDVDFESMADGAGSEAVNMPEAELLDTLPTESVGAPAGEYRDQPDHATAGGAPEVPDTDPGEALSDEASEAVLDDLGEPVPHAVRPR
jgi:segregation and condensation protein B